MSFWLGEMGVRFALMGRLGCSIPDLLLEAGDYEKE